MCKQYCYSNLNALDYSYVAHLSLPAQVHGKTYGWISSRKLSFSSEWMFWLTFGWGHFITKILRNFFLWPISRRCTQEQVLRFNWQFWHPANHRNIQFWTMGGILPPFTIIMRETYMQQNDASKTHLPFPSFPLHFWPHIYTSSF